VETHIKCLTQACDKQNIKYQSLDDEKNVIKVALGDGLLFQQNRTPFNTEVIASICKDKGHAYQILNKQIAMPKTIGFLDFNTHDHFQKYVNYPSQEAIISEIERAFSYPVVVKRNRGALGINVFFCRDRSAVKAALDEIFNRNSCSYDYIALAQEYIQPKQEFRVVFFRKEHILCYQRVSENKEFGLRYWDTNKGHALPINDPEELSALTKFIKPALELPGLNYVGFDIIKNHQGEYCLLEMNSGPKYNHYIQSCGEGKIITMYEKMLRKICAGS